MAIARALVTNPDVVFADEPTGELDSATAISVTTILKDIAQHKRVTVVVATHDLTLSRTSDRRVNMEDGALTEDSTSAS